jgi:hypothetical protein
MPAQPGVIQPGPAQPGLAQPGEIPRGQPRPAPPGQSRQASGRPEDARGRGGDREPEGSQGAREPRGLRRWGSLPGWLGVGIIAASAALGAGATVLTRTTPGLVLGASVVGGTVVAALAVRPRAGRVIFPAPVLFYLIAAFTAGIIHDRSAASSNTALAIDATQWIANGFFAMTLATVLAIVLAGVRWFIWRRNRRVPAAAAGSSPMTEAAEYGGAAVRRDGGGPGEWRYPGPPAPRRPQGPQGPDQQPGPRPQQRPGWHPDQRPGRPGSGPYNFSSGA